MPSDVTDSYYVVEVAPNLFLEEYSQGGAYCASKSLYRVFRYEGEVPEIRRNAARFDDLKDIGKYICRKGSKDDFLSWCQELKQRYGGDGKPKVRKVTATVSVGFEEAMEFPI